MRIALLNLGYGWRGRGSEVFLRQLLHGLVALREDYFFDVYNTRLNGREGPRVSLYRVPSISEHSRLAKLYAQVGHRIRFYLRMATQFQELTFSLMVLPRLLAGKYDLLFNIAGPYAGMACWLVRRLTGTPFVRRGGSVYNGYIEVIEARQHPDAFLALTPVHAAWIREQVPSVNVVTIPPAVNYELFSPERGSADLNLPHPIVMFAGAMDHMKRPHLVVEALALMESASLLMIGDGPLREQVAQVAMEKLGPARFLGIPCLPHEEMVLYYNACDVFTLPSEEPTGNVFLEALACDKPVVAHNSPVQAWMFGEAGRLCDCTRADEYAKTLQTALETVPCGEPRRRAEEFTWERVINDYHRTFREVVRNGGR